MAACRRTSRTCPPGSLAPPPPRRSPPSSPSPRRGRAEKWATASCRGAALPPRHLLHFRHRRQRVVALTTMLPRPLQLPAAAAAQPRRRRRRHRDAAAPPRRHAPCPHRLLPTCYLRRNRQRVARHRHRHCHRHRCPRDRGPHSGSYCQHPPGSVRRLLRAATMIAAPSQFIVAPVCPLWGSGARAQALDVPEG